MAITPEEFFVESLMEQIPPSPSAFINLPQSHAGGGENQLTMDDSVLPHISRVLMEDEIEDSILYSDHPALLKVQRPFAQILFSDSFRTNKYSTGPYASTPLLVTVRGNEGVGDGLLLRNDDQDKLNSDLSKGLDAVGAFLKGMEEARRLLPNNSGFTSDELVDNICSESIAHKVLKKRENRDKHLEDEVGRARKSTSYSRMKEMEEICELFDDLMLHSSEACIRDMKKLRVAMDNVILKHASKATMDTVDLRTLLVLCAQAVATGNHASADELLKKIKQHASAKGDATQRLAQCFCEGLEARLAGTGSKVNKFLMDRCPSVREFLEAYKLYMAASGFYKVALVFNITTILHAMEGKSRLHIVEFGTIFGLQWASLFRQLANREGGPPEVKITSIDSPQPRSLPTERIEETGRRLSNCARNFGLPFKFHSITAAWEAVGIEDLNTNADEVLVVNDLFNLSTLMDERIFVDNPSPKEMVLNNIRKMCPDVFIQSIVNCSSGTSFLTRFREALFYLTALFDMLDATIPRESESRLVLEQDLLGRCVLNAIACEGEDLMDWPEKYRQWEVRNKRAGLRQLPLKPNIVQLVRDKVMKFHHKDFLLGKDDKWLIHGWMGRVLFAHSTWVANDVPFSK